MSSYSLSCSHPPHHHRSRALKAKKGFSFSVEKCSWKALRRNKPNSCKSSHLTLHADCPGEASWQPSVCGLRGVPWIPLGEICDLNLTSQAPPALIPSWSVWLCTKGREAARAAEPLCHISVIQRVALTRVVCPAAPRLRLLEREPSFPWLSPLLCLTGRPGGTFCRPTAGEQQQWGLSDPRGWSSPGSLPTLPTCSPPFLRSMWRASRDSGGA